MTDLLDDKNNLVILEELVSGNAVSVNYSQLSRVLEKHRHTMIRRVQRVLECGLLKPPSVPFLGLAKVYPLLVILHIEVPDDERFVQWIKQDPYILAAFKTRHLEHNTILLIYQKNISSYLRWRESLPAAMKAEYKIPEHLTRFASMTSYYANDLMVKYDPSSGIALVLKEFEDYGNISIRDCILNSADLEVAQCLTKGVGLKINQTLLCDKTGLHRKTVQNRISALIKAGYIRKPVCSFPSLFVPPGCNLVLSLVEIKKNRDKILSEFIKDEHIPILFKTLQGKYNAFVFSNHYRIEDHLRWDEDYRTRFPGCFGHASITYLTPMMTISFDWQIVSLLYIRNRMGIHRGRELRRALQPK